jgi:hypothetical protein
MDIPWWRDRLTRTECRDLAQGQQLARGEEKDRAWIPLKKRVSNPFRAATRRPGRRRRSAEQAGSFQLYVQKCLRATLARCSATEHLETVLAGFNAAYNGRRQRVLKGRSPDMALHERLKAKPELAKPVTRPPDPDALPRALKVVADAKEVSHPDS